MVSSSSSESDRDLEADMEALRRARMLTGADVADVGAAGSVGDSDSDSDYGTDSSGSEDLGLLHRLKERFSLPSPGMDSSAIVMPLSAIPPPELDDEDDFETLRAIQRRFTQYESDSLSGKSEKIVEDPAVFANDDLCGPTTPNRPAEFTKEHVHKLLDQESCNSDVGDLESSKFPKSAQNFFDAIKKNRSCQKFIRRKLIEIDAKIEKNKELKERVKCLMDFQVACRRNVTNTICQKKDPRLTLISAKIPMPEKSSKANLKKVPPLCLGPRENSHVSNYRVVLERFPISLHKQPWSKTEIDNLTKGIKQQYQEMLILNSMNMGSDTECITDSLLEFTPEVIRSFIPSVNWNRLASMYVTGRSGAECEVRWLNCEDPMINHDPWTAMEDKKLLFIVQERGIYNWIDISVALGTDRTPFQCLVRYQRSLNPHIINKDWTEEEDAKLCAAVENYGKKNWQMVASCLEGRTGTQCSNRWYKTLNPERKKVGRWSVDEDKRLKVAVMLFGGKNWDKIACFTPGRTQVQCRERWLNCLDPALNLEPWTEEEDAKLLNAIAVHGNCWSKIADCIPPRTDNQCRRRWKILFPGEVKRLQAAARIKKTALISNFVDRESERPAIGPDDFTQLAMIENIDGAEVRKKKLSNNLPKKSGINRKRVKEDSKLSNYLPKKSRTKPRRVKEDSKTVPSELTLPADVESNSFPGLGMMSGSICKRPRSNIPKNSRVKCIKKNREKLTEYCMINASSNVAPVNMPHASAVSLSAEVSKGNENTMAKTLSEDQQNSSIGSRIPIAENSTTDHITLSAVDISSDDLPLAFYMNTNSNPNNRRKRKKESVANEMRKGKRRKESRPMDVNQPLMSKAEAERSLKENFTVNNIVNPSTELVPADVHLLLDANASKAMESISNPCKTTKRKRQSAKSRPQDTLAGENGSSRLLVSEKDSAVGMIPCSQRTRDMDTSRAMSGGGATSAVADDNDDSSFLSTFYKKAKRKRQRIISEKDAQASAGSSEIRATNGGGGGGDDDGGGDDNDSSLLVLFYQKAKRKRQSLVTEQNTKAAVGSSKLLKFVFSKLELLLLPQINWKPAKNSISPRFQLLSQFDSIKDVGLLYGMIGELHI
ncbi:snRNA-activating protein complex subunit 4-like isoform X1 [Canna indica]|uniref:snRNA-activating protein complex subunit 4-like isoform X1 n=1 Tax=Canna indica TaxID=4628 RepID=A0AAQ3L1V1_9LILI|nr:snRNA-activating protein complex subunit 4-like isoform X1 [Canna indica]